MQVLQLLSKSFMGSDIGAKGVIGVGGNPRVRLSDHITLSHTSTANQGEQTQVAAVRNKFIH